MTISQRVSIILFLIAAATWLTFPRDHRVGAQVYRPGKSTPTPRPIPSPTPSRRPAAKPTLKPNPTPEPSPPSSNGGKSDEALSDLISRLRKTGGAILKNPKGADLHNELGRMLENEGNIDMAVAEYKKATQLPPNVIGSAFLYRDLGMALEKKGDLDGAIAAMQQSVRRWPNKNNLHCANYEVMQLVRLLEKKGDIDQAIEFYRPLYEKNVQVSRCRITYERLTSRKKS